MGAAGRALGWESPGTADPLHNKGPRDLWPGQETGH